MDLNLNNVCFTQLFSIKSQQVLNCAARWPAAQSLNYCLYCKKSHQLQLKKHNFHIDVLSCRQFYPTEIAFINKTKDNSKQSHDTTAILI